jgi:aspartokinase
MRTVADVVHTMVMETPFLEEMLARGLINLSALARQLKPGVEEALLKPASEASLVMALRRLTPRLESLASGPARPMRLIEDFTVRSDLVELTYARSEHIIGSQQELLRSIRHEAHRFVTFTQGVYEVTMVLDAGLEQAARTAFRGESLIERLDDLAAVTIRLAKQTVGTPGVHYNILKLLAMRGINVVEVVSTLTELSVVLGHRDVDRAFAALMRSHR